MFAVGDRVEFKATVGDGSKDHLATIVKPYKERGYDGDPYRNYGVRYDDHRIGETMYPISMCLSLLVDEPLIEEDWS